MDEKDLINQKYDGKIMKIRSLDEEFRKLMANALKSVKKEEARLWSEYELRCLIQDEFFILHKQIEEKNKKMMEQVNNLLSHFNLKTDEEI